MEAVPVGVEGVPTTGVTTWVADSVAEVKQALRATTLITALPLNVAFQVIVPVAPEPEKVPADVGLTDHV